jgi:hypothetical protein
MLRLSDLLRRASGRTHTRSGAAQQEDHQCTHVGTCLPVARLSLSAIVMSPGKACKYTFVICLVAAIPVAAIIVGSENDGLAADTNCVHQQPLSLSSFLWLMGAMLGAVFFVVSALAHWGWPCGERGTRNFVWLLSASCAACGIVGGLCIAANRSCNHPVLLVTAVIMEIILCIAAIAMPICFTSCRPKHMDSAVAAAGLLY